jgi:hypothetical protein
MMLLQLLVENVILRWVFGVRAINRKKTLRVSVVSFFKVPPLATLARIRLPEQPSFLSRGILAKDIRLSAPPSLSSHQRRISPDYWPA